MKDTTSKHLVDEITIYFKGELANKHGMHAKAFSGEQYSVQLLASGVLFMSPLPESGAGAQIFAAGDWAAVDVSVKPNPDYQLLQQVTSDLASN